MNLLEQWLSYPAAPDRVLSTIGIEIHWLILQYVLGLPLLIAVALLAYKKSGDSRWERMARTMTKALGLVFAVGAASGTASEFGLVVVWPNVLEAAGRYLFFPLYLEIFAFLTEIVFIYLLVFGWGKLSTNAKIAVAFLAMFGAWFSGAMITSVNSYMVAPTGIVPAYDPFSGWKYDQGYPKVLLVVPREIVGVLDVGKLQSLGMEVVGDTGQGVAVKMPSRIVARLAAEAWGGVRVRDSVLKLVVKPEAVGAVGDLLVKDVVDRILLLTVQTVGYTTVTFQSPVYPGTLLHSIGAGLTVTAFTVLGAYSLLLLRSRDEKSREYYLLGLKFGAIASLLTVFLQGAVFGHVMGEEIAKYNPEKLAAMEGTSSSILSISRLLGLEKLMAFIAYGSFDARLPGYDGIPVDYCTLLGAPRVTDCRPPLVVHYLYYAKVGLSVLLGLYALLLVLLLYRRANLPGYLLWLGALSPVLAQLVSFLGWAVREIGRKPWTVYGVMTVDVAHTANPADPLAYVIVALLFLGALAGLVYASWKVLYEPSVKG
ncbi:cytochrome ubiquinol oxidase subunit I [Infirmifilum lucidum]|uniref:Cytochrome ubiquinol oxidase subunit I n=1 Tax=Infirmifilum lucidum TaxID=2776706 RepID=A0A7L9FJJ1_9CREN|nr:cytochrome ubiquinol oxidase subunit I [Infirmifilum lucidum]QOJ79056.1 cytochrome ubiquinol oxidase subunit I [Infirmifilum lucidum]